MIKYVCCLIILLICGMLNFIKLYPVTLPIFHFILWINSSYRNNNEKENANTACEGLFDSYYALGLYDKAVKYYDQFAANANYRDDVRTEEYRLALKS